MRKLTIERTFNHPIERVWDAFTNPEILKLWWSPPGISCRIISVDLKEGGEFRFVHKMDETGQEVYCRGVYQKIDPPKYLSYTDSFTDEAGKDVGAKYYGMGSDEVVETLVEFFFTEKNAQTHLKLVHESPYDEKMNEGMVEGWNGMFDNLTKTIRNRYYMKTKYTILAEENKLIAERSFNAPKSKVWKYYTTSELLDKWWGPEPYKAVTKSFDFSEGGHWHYVMRGPEGDAHFCINNYKTINPEDSFTALDAFAHEDWSINVDMPGSDWEVTFTQNGELTDVKVVLTTQTREALETLETMGMKEGFDMGLNQLEALLEK